MSKSIEISRKKEKILSQERPVPLSYYEPLRSDFVELLKNFKPGASLRSATDISFRLNNKPHRKPYLLKSADPFVAAFSTDLLRILSNKQYACKDLMLTLKDNVASAEVLIKWDANLNHNSGSSIVEHPLDRILNIKKIEEKSHFAKTKTQIERKEMRQTLVKNYSRLVGVLGVLGKSDYNPDNIMISLKTFRPVEIDSYSFFNSSTPKRQEKIIGSSFTNDFLRIFLGHDIDSPFIFIKNLRDKQFLKLNKILNPELNFNEEIGKIYIDSYKKDIDIILLEKIKINIEKNPFLKECFIEMMQGIEDAIELANDDVFLKQYAAKFAGIEAEDFIADDEIAAVVKQKTIPELIVAFKENAAQAREQYALFLQYFEEINPNRDPKAPLKYTISQKDFISLLKRERQFLTESNEKNISQLKLYDSLLQQDSKIHTNYNILLDEFKALKEQKTNLKESISSPLKFTHTTEHDFVAEEPKKPLFSGEYLEQDLKLSLEEKKSMLERIEKALEKNLLKIEQLRAEYNSSQYQDIYAILLKLQEHNPKDIIQKDVQEIEYKIKIINDKIAKETGLAGDHTEFLPSSAAAAAAAAPTAITSSSSQIKLQAREKSGERT